ncbi:MAG TPA: hypothetical protein VFV38_48695 [Ktedonobacteraceae bacterium]|nr:hypothetical protein [Ktedonobacteraceae bacterium]
MFYYSQFKTNKNTQKQKQHVTNMKYTTPTTGNTSGTPARVAYQVRTEPMTRVTPGAQDIQMFLHDASYYSSVITEEGVLEVHSS